MAQTGYTPILIYASGTASNVPLAANLTSSASGAELALNYADGKLFYKDSGGTVQVLAGKGGTGVVAGSNTQLQFNNNGVFGASSSLTWDGTYLTAGSIKNSALTSGRVTYAGASGLLTDSSNFTFSSGTLTVGTSVVTPTLGAASGATLSIQANGTTYATVLGAGTNNGYFGIGTNNPAYQLHVSASGAIQGAIATTSSLTPGASLVLVGSGSVTGKNFMIGSNWFNADSFQISPSTTGGGTTFTSGAIFTLKSNGYLGLGSTSPTATLNVVAPAADNVISVFGGNNANGALLDIYDYANSLHRGYIGYGTNTISGAALADLCIATGASGSGKIRFGNNGGSSTIAYLDSNANLVISGSATITGLTGALQIGTPGGTASTNNPSPAIVSFQSSTGGVPQFIGNWATTGWWGIGQHSSSADNTVRIGTVNIGVSGAAFSSYANLQVASVAFGGTSNALNDYEEGTWGVTDQSGAGLTFSLATGVYRKIGKLVYIQIDLIFPSTADSRQVKLSLPFASAPTSNDGSSGGGASNYFSGAGIAQAYVSPTGTAAFVCYYSTGGLSNVMPNSLASGRELSFAFCYHTSS